MTPTRNFDGYTFAGQLALGECIAHFRVAIKPPWKPVVAEGLSVKEIQAEQEGWTQSQMATIINREFGLDGENAITQSAIYQLECPSPGEIEPPLRLIELIASLEICLSPNGAPYTNQNLKDIAKERLKWQTGLRLDTSDRFNSTENEG